MQATQQAKSVPVPQATPEPAPKQTVTAVGGAEVEQTEIPRDIYDEAVEENRQRNFMEMLSMSRNPAPKPAYVPPPVAPQMAEQTRLELEEGRKRVLAAEEREDERKRITELHKNDRWADKPPESVFRPGNHVPAVNRPVNARAASVNV